MREIKMEHIINASSPIKAFEGDVPLLMLTGESNVGLAVYGLNKLFKENKETQEVEVHLEGIMKGYLRHADVRKILSSTTRTSKGVDRSGGSSLGGGGADDLELFEYECPEEGCTKRKTLIFPLPGQQPKCPVHDKPMEKIK